MLKSFLSGDVIHQQCSDGTSIIRASDGSEILLACSVPDLQFDIFIPNINSLGPELNADSNIMGRPGLILDKLQHNAWFTDTCVSDDDEFKQVMVRVHFYMMLDY